MLIAIGMAMTLTANPEFNGAGADGSQDATTGLGRWLLFGGFLLGAVATVAIDILIKKKRIDMITSVYFGLLVGLFLTYIVNLAVAPLFGLQSTFTSVVLKCPPRLYGRSWLPSLGFVCVTVA